MLSLAISVLLAGFDPAATIRHLSHPEEQATALRSFASLLPVERKAARAADIGQIVVMLATDSAIEFENRVLAVRAVALIGGPGVNGPLRILTQSTHSPEAVALAREAARALLQLGAVESLDSARTSLDPEVRAYAGRAGGGVALCILLADAWPMVRAAAAAGLGKRPSSPKCLARALEHDHPRVRLNAARSAQSAPDPILRAPLRKLAGDARAPIDARVEAFVGLAFLGDYEPAKKALATHLSKGGIVPLALASLRAFDVGDGHLEALRSGLSSETDSVRVAAARLLVAREDTESQAALVEMAGSVGPRHRGMMRKLLKRLEASTRTGFVIDREAPEDEEP